jgi:3-oxoacyl-[acyl-carrier protein] reductase
MLEGKVAIITGAGRGIGRAAAELLAAQGARVVVADVDAAAAADTVAALGEGAATSVVGNLVEPGEPERVVEAAVDAFGAIDIVVNNAGYTLDAALHTMTDEAWHAMLDIHASVPFRLLRAAAPHLRDPAKRERAEGREVWRKVVNVTCVSGTMGNAGQANYSAAKAAVVGLTKTLAKEWGPFRVNVNAVAFGFIETRLTAERGDDNVHDIAGRDVQLGVPQHVRSVVEMFAPAGRVGTPREAAGPILFLASPLSDYVTGQVLTVSGGLPVGMSS